MAAGGDGKIGERDPRTRVGDPRGRARGEGGDGDPVESPRAAWGLRGAGKAAVGPLWRLAAASGAHQAEGRLVGDAEDVVEDFEAERLGDHEALLVPKVALARDEAGAQDSLWGVGLLEGTVRDGAACQAVCRAAPEGRLRLERLRRW